MNRIVYSAKRERRLHSFNGKQSVRRFCRGNTHKRRICLCVIERYRNNRFIYNDVTFKLRLAEELFYSRLEKVFRIGRACAFAAEIHSGRKRSRSRIVRKAFRIEQKSGEEHIRLHLRKRSGGERLFKKFGEQLRRRRRRRLYINNARSDLVFTGLSVVVDYDKIAHVADNVRSLAESEIVHVDNNRQRIAADEILRLDLIRKQCAVFGIFFKTRKARRKVAVIFVCDYIDLHSAERCESRNGKARSKCVKVRKAVTHNDNV